MNLALFQQVYQLAAYHQVSFSCHFNEGSGEWHFAVHGHGPENFTGADHSFDLAAECVIDHLSSLGKKS